MKRPASHGGSAFSLVEVTLALGIAAFALVTIFGLLPIGLNSNRASIGETAATNVVSAIVADLRMAPTATAIAANPQLKTISPAYGVDVAQSYTAASPKVLYLDESGQLQTSAATARYKAAIILTPPPAASKAATCGTVTVGWPAAADVSAGTVSAFIALDRN